MDEKSSGEKGTSFAEMNRSSCSNAKKGPTKDYNAFKDFHDESWMQDWFKYMSKQFMIIHFCLDLRLSTGTSHTR